MNAVFSVVVVLIFAVCPAGWKPGSDTVSTRKVNTDKVLISLYVDEILSLDFYL